VTGTVGLLLVAFVLSGLALGSYAWRVTRIDSSQPDRLIGELRLAQWTALLYAATGGTWIGLAVIAQADLLANIDLLLGVTAVVLAAFVLRLEPRAALLTLAIAFVAHALLDIAHRPGGLSPTIAPQRFIVGCAAYDIYLAALCFWTRGR
jgi:hypothetical protein